MLQEGLRAPPPIILRMHLLIPFASALSEAGLHTLRDLDLPHLSRLPGRLQPTDRVGSDEFSLSPPHETALARHWGWEGADGALPFAAHAAALDGIDVGDRAWGLLTPVHWHVGRDQVTLADPIQLGLDADASRAIFEAVRELFESEGFVMAWGAPLRWYAAHESLVELPCASLDRVVSRNVDRWLPQGSQARLVRRLQSEVQLLLYPHAINEAREAQGQLSVNSFWLSGCGRFQPVAGDEVQVHDGLRAPMLADDWAAWADAWRAIDAGPIAEALARAQRGEPVVITLCGERFAQRFEAQPRTLWQRVAARWQAASPPQVLEPL
jgi:hypothetical protein